MAKEVKKYSREDAEKWAAQFRGGDSILKVASREGVDPGTVGKWLHKLGIQFRQGHHRVVQPPLSYSSQFIELAKGGPKRILELLDRGVWGLVLSQQGTKQVAKFCEFVRLHGQGVGVVEIARKLGVHRTTVAEWRNGTDQPYLIRTANSIVSKHLQAGSKWLPLHLTSGGNEQSDWVEVPENVASFDEIVAVLELLGPNKGISNRARKFGLSRDLVVGMHAEMFAHALGMLVGDAGKMGGEQARFSSMRMDLQLTLKEPSNERLGEFVALDLNSLGLKMERVADKAPSGATRRAENPSASFRWASESSPLIAWMFKVCLGLDWNQKTSLDRVEMEWIFGAPRGFRRRFIQGLADSDGTVKDYVVEIASMPNAEFVTRLLQSVGMKTAHTVFEKGLPTRSCVHNAEASSLPIFNEFVSGYRYQKLMKSKILSADLSVTLEAGAERFPIS